MDIFAQTTRPRADLVAPRKDAVSRTVGEAVLGERSEYERARVIVLGCPQDIGVRRNEGRPGAEEAPSEIRKALYRFPAPRGLDEGVVYDLGDTRIAETLEATHDTQRAIARQLLADGKRVIVLGGGNDISYPDVAALSEVTPDLLVFNIDSHFDVREGDPRHSGTPYRQLLEEKYVRPPHFYQMASKLVANAPDYEEYLREKGVRVHPLEELRDRGVKALFQEILKESPVEAVFWGFDLDAVRSNDAPGVSAPYPLGLTAEEICMIAALAGREERTRMIELTEMNPRHDIDGRTARLAAMMILYYLTEALPILKRAGSAGDENN